MSFRNISDSEHCISLPLTCQCYSEVDNFDLEGEGGVGRDDTAGTSCAVGVIRGAGEDGLLALLELSDALVPALDDLADTDDKLEGLSAGDAGIEDGTVGKFAGVVDLDFGATGDDGAGALVKLLNGERHISYLITISKIKDDLMGFWGFGVLGF